jgi:hypothetical protein
VVSNSSTFDVDAIPQRLLLAARQFREAVGEPVPQPHVVDHLIEPGLALNYPTGR